VLRVLKVLKVLTLREVRRVLEVRAQHTCATAGMRITTNART
jgi:hypothetical protein